VKKYISVVALAASLVGCVGRAAAPIASTEMGDLNLGCQQILSEVQNNVAKRDGLTREMNSNNTRNNWIAFGSGLLLSPPGLLLLDLNKAKVTEYNAYAERNKNLRMLAEHQGCMKDPIIAKQIDDLFNPKTPQKTQPQATQSGVHAAHRQPWNDPGVEPAHIDVQHGGMVTQQQSFPQQAAPMTTAPAPYSTTKPNVMGKGTLTENCIWNDVKKDYTCVTHTN